MLIVYGIQGYTETNLKIPVNGGSAWLECEFKHGRIGAGLANKPATYATRNVTEQNIIQNSHFFKSGYIQVVRVAEEDEVTEKPAASASPADPVDVKVPGVTTREEAVAFLKQRGAKATNLRDDNAIKSYMSKIGVSFPNLSL